MKYYHISAIPNKESILTNGLRSEHCAIFLFTKLEQAQHISINQVGLHEYSMFEISADGMTGGIIPDEVAEYGAKYQVILEQELIEPQHITLLSDEYHNPLDLIEANDSVKFKAMGFSDEKILDYMRMFPDRLERYNEVNGTSLTVMTGEQWNAKHS